MPHWATCRNPVTASLQLGHNTKVRRGCYLKTMTDYVMKQSTLPFTQACCRLLCRLSFLRGQQTHHQYLDLQFFPFQSRPSTGGGEQVEEAADLPCGLPHRLL